MRVAVAALLLAGLIACGDTPPPEPPPPTTTVPAATTTPPAPPPEPPPETSRPQDYIQWSCHASKPACRNRFSWSSEVDQAYTVWRGERDLRALLGAPEYLKGGDEEIVDLTPAELEAVIGRMEAVNARGDTLIYRIENEEHRDFDADPLGDWHRSQVRKDVAAEMVDELEAQTAVYTSIAELFPPVAGCDSIRCKLGKI